MNQQPDTKTLAGKIAVMQAHADGKRIQGMMRGPDDSSGWRGGVIPSWNWDECDYRIHPDDLNPRKPATYRQWTPEEARGCWIKRKQEHTDTAYLITGTTSVLAQFDNSWFGYAYLLEHCTLLDGSPCGVMGES